MLLEDDTVYCAVQLSFTTSEIQNRKKIYDKKRFFDNFIDGNIIANITQCY